MNRSRVALIGLLVAVTVTAILCWQLLAPGHDAAGDAAVLAGQGNEAAAALPDAAASLAGSTPDALAAAAGDVSGESADGSGGRAVANYPHRSIAGTVVMADGSPLPRDLRLSASLLRPKPEIKSMREMLNDDEAEDAWPVRLQEGHDGHALTPPGATTDWQRPDAGQLAELTATTVGADGRFAMHHLPPLRAWVVVDDDELYADPPAVVAPGAESVLVRLVRGAVVTGRVTDGDGHPQAEATLEGQSQFDPWMAMDSTARLVEFGEVETDAEGRYFVRQVPAEQPLVMVARPPPGKGLQPDRHKLTALQPGERRELDCVLQRASRVAGLVRSLDEQPLAGADVALRRIDLSVSDMSGLAEDGGRDEATTDAEGRFAFEEVPDGKYLVVLDETGYRAVKSAKLDLRDGREVSDIVLVADPGLTVAGTVVDPDGKPVAEADVAGRRPRSLMDFSAAFDGGGNTRGETDAEGRFQLAGFEAGNVELTVRAPGFIAAEQEVPAGTTGVTVALQASCSLSGIVVSTADGEPVQDFRAGLSFSGGLFDPSDPLGIEKRMQSASSSQSFRYREDGTFTLADLEPGTYDLTVQAKGFGETTVEGLEIGPEGRKGQVVMLPPEAVVTGQVVTARTGLPIEGAEVAPREGSGIEQMFAGMMGQGPRASTDGEGRFRIGGLDSQPVSLHVQHPAFREHTAEPLVLQPGESRDLGRIALSDGGRVFGRVLDQGGRGVPSVVVLLTNSTGTLVKRDSTDPAGRYEIRGLPPGTFNVMRADFTMELGEDSSPMDFLKDLVMQAVTLAEDEEREVDLRVATGGGTRVHGAVRAAGGPVEGAMVSLLPDRGGYDRMGMAMTDKRGAYEMEDVKPGRYTLQVVMLDGGMTAGSQPSSPVVERLDVGGGPELRRDIQLPGGVLNGRVESATDGKAIAGVRLILQRTDEGRLSEGLYSRMEGRVGETYSDAEGGFQFRYLPSGTYAVLAGGRNVVGMGQSGWARTRLEDIKVAADDSGFTVRLKLRPAGSIAGRVTNAAGQPVEAASVWVRDGQGGWLATLSETTTDSSGRYEVPDLSPGDFSLAFRADGYGFTVVPGILVREGAETPQDVTLPAGVALKLSTGDLSPWSLAVALTGPDGPLPTELTAISDLAASIGGEAALLVGSFAPGEYHLTVVSEGQTILDTPVVLVAGEGSHVVTL